MYEKKKRKLYSKCEEMENTKNTAIKWSLKCEYWKQDSSVASNFLHFFGVRNTNSKTFENLTYANETQRGEKNKGPGVHGTMKKVIYLSGESTL